MSSRGDKAPGPGRKAPAPGTGRGAKSTNPGSGRGPKSTTPKSAGTKPKQSGSKAVVPRGPGTVAPRGAGAMAPRGRGGGQGQSMIVPEGYTMREVKPAKNYDVVSFARAMNDDFGPRVKKLFDIETEAALDAQQTGIYIGWRLPGQNFDCQRVNKTSKCFCGHMLAEHDKYNGRSVHVKCKSGGCKCKAFAWIPSRPEDVGEFWFQRRRNFDPSTWRAKCRCKHSHEEHDPISLRRCRSCPCGAFDSNFLCAACDKHWEEHETFFETAEDRKPQGLPVGEEYIPFAEIPSLRNMVLTGEDDGDMSYMAVQAPPDMRRHPRGGPSDMRALPPSGPPADNSSPFSPGGSKGGFRPVYD